MGTKIELQIFPKDKKEICVLNLNIAELNNAGIKGTLQDSYCRIMSVATAGDFIKESQFPLGVQQELSSVIETNVLPKLKGKGVTCQEAFAILEDKQLASMYGSDPYFNMTKILSIEAKVSGCIEEVRDEL